MSPFDPLAQEGNGAIEVAHSNADALLVVLIGPIRQWWKEWGSERHEEYTKWRDAVRVMCVKSGFLVYSPHRAWQGAWNEKAQEVNDKAICVADVVINLTPPGVEAQGTEREAAFANMLHQLSPLNPKHPYSTRCLELLSAPPGDERDLERLRDTLAALRP